VSFKHELTFLLDVIRNRYSFSSDVV